jgi:hypothetical protein
VCFEPESSDSGGLPPPPRSASAVVRPLCPPPRASRVYILADGKVTVRPLTPGACAWSPRTSSRTKATGDSWATSMPGAGRCVPATEVWGPLGPWLRWSLWMVGRWPCLTRRFLEGAALWYPPFAGVPTGSGPSTRGPYAAANPRPPGRPGWNTCVSDWSRGLSGGNWMVVCVFPGAPGLPRRPGASLRPCLVAQLSPPSAGGLGSPGGPALCRL